MVVLENKSLSAKINLIGAELIVLKRKGNENVLWNPDFSFWNRTAPNLFPIVGRLLNDKYQYNNCFYEMKQHGFARDLPFTIIEQTQDRVQLQLIDSVETRKNYPFNFEFYVAYELIEDRIQVTYRTFNGSNENMPYSVGGHPGFILTSPINHYRLNFHTKFEDEHWLIDNGYYSDEKKAMKIDQFLNLTNDYFSNDAIVFKRPKFSSVTLEKENAEQLVTVGSSNWDAIGFWTKANAPFFCIEPWWGWADSHDSNGKIEDKEGIHWLNPDQEETISYFIQVH
jgi:galactose mutarotase-like enzyme